MIVGSICAWCSEWLEAPTDAPEDAEISHGICSECVGGMLSLPVTNVYDLGAHEADALAFGVIGLDRDGVVTDYNAAEASLSGLDRERVIGRNFFTEVAPCTLETEFEERWKQLREVGEGKDEFTFVFRFSSGHKIVQVRALMKTGGRSLLLIKEDA